MSWNSENFEISLIILTTLYSMRLDSVDTTGSVISGESHEEEETAVERVHVQMGVMTHTVPSKLAQCIDITERFHARHVLIEPKPWPRVRIFSADVPLLLGGLCY